MSGRCAAGSERRRTSPRGTGRIGMFSGDMELAYSRSRSSAARRPSTKNEKVTGFTRHFAEITKRCRRTLKSSAIAFYNLK